MSQLVVLNLGKGNWQQGFATVVAQLWQSHSRTPIQFTGSLPPASQLVKLYQNWKKLYLALSVRLSWRLDFDEEDITNISQDQLDSFTAQLKQDLNRWLDSQGFSKIERQLRTILMPSETVRVIVETEDEQMRRLPWHLWNFFEDYPQAEVALSTQEHKPPPPRQPREYVRILAILGNSEGIAVERDRSLLEQLPHAETHFLVQPSRQELNHILWDEQGWDILFFAGHSSSQPDGAMGTIELNQSQRLTIAQLKYALQAAIARGLQLAIFNSCDGLGLARALADLFIPQLIVMREPVPDLVAQEFLKHFLTAFSGGKSFYLAVREARQKLQGLEHNFPCATWLPTICQNPAVIPPTWRDLYGKFSGAKRRQGWRLALIVSLAIASLVVGTRQLGLLQFPELKAFDLLMRLRPDEGIDQRLLLIKVTEADRDLDAQNPKQRLGASLSDHSLEELLDKLKQHQPRVIGLDIYHDYPVESKKKKLATWFEKDNRLITICRTGKTGTPPPPNINSSAWRARVGFSNTTIDRDGVVRRHLLGQAPPKSSKCTVDNAFSLLLALRYLVEEGIQAQKIEAGVLQIGPVVLDRVQEDTVGYHRIDAKGYQMMLNYRAGRAIASELTLTEAIHEGKLTAELVRDRIVLIGTVDPTFQDFHLTPYSRSYYQTISGVEIQAQMVSQLVSAVLDGRPLLWWWSKWMETIWIVAWSLLGGIIAWKCRSPLSFAFMSGGALIILVGFCYLLLIQGGWIPLVPPLLGLAIASAVTALALSHKLKIFQSYIG